MPKRILINVMRISPNISAVINPAVIGMIKGTA